MSSFLCSDLHTAVVALAMTKGKPFAKRADLMSKLRKLNNEALAHRYGDAPARLSRRSAALQEATEWCNKASYADLKNVVGCFTYQCSEGRVMECNLGMSLRALEDSLSIEALKAGCPESHIWSI